MSKAEILAELPKLTPEELTEIQARIEDLATYGPDGWRADSDLTEAEERLIESRLDDLDQHPEKSIPWAEAEARLKARFGK
jgi:transcription elongation GreA/GreB family factor